MSPLAEVRILDLRSATDRAALDELLAARPSAAARSGEVAEMVAELLDAIVAEGDDAVVRYMRQFSHPAYTADDLVVPQAALAAAVDGIEPALRAALERAVDNVRAYQQHIRPQVPPPLSLAGAEVGLRFTPVASAGLLVPGGSGAYPSTLIMLAVPAQEAGVDTLAVATPPRPGGDRPEVDATVLAVCRMLGIEMVYRIGGAAVGAMALGTGHIRPVEMLAGPGNVYSQQAKRQLYGQVGVDGLYGPSEVMLWVDETANPEWVAADVLAQAEHDPGSALVVASDDAVLEAVASAIVAQSAGRQRRDAIAGALAQWCALLRVADAEQARATIDRVAPEHLTIACRGGEQEVARIRHAGAIFVGDQTPVASGDYLAGPSHCLPTGGTARFESGCSVYTFCKRTSLERYPAGLPAQAIDDIVTISSAEGFEAHAHSARVRHRPD